MQSLDVISVNLWQILISLCNLVILFGILKKFLYKPVSEVVKNRKSVIDEMYKKAETAEKSADEAKKQWEEKLKTADQEAEEIIALAKKRGKSAEESIVASAEEKAFVILNNAKADAAAQLKNTRDKVKDEIVNVSVILTEEMLKREINVKDHKQLIEKVIAEMGEEDVKV